MTFKRYHRHSLFALSISLGILMLVTAPINNAWARDKASGLLITQTPFGQWVGHYFCPQGMTGLTLTVREDKSSVTQNAIVALFDFYPLPGNSTMFGQFTMEGSWNAEADEIKLQPLDWINQPDGWKMVGLSLKPSKDFDLMTGIVTDYHCGPVHLIRR